MASFGVAITGPSIKGMMKLTRRERIGDS